MIEGTHWVAGVVPHPNQGGDTKIQPLLKIQMLPEIKLLKEKKLIGLKTEMSFAENKTGELWKNFMPRYSEIGNRVGKDLFSLQIYDPSFAKGNFDPHLNFCKWAAVEVFDFEIIPTDMVTLTIPEGKYAVFSYKGSSAEANEFFRYVFSDWLPKSGFRLDHRPHFEILSDKYKTNDSNSEEEIWIPIQ